MANSLDIQPGAGERLNALLGEIYSTDGTYQRLQNIAFNCGVISCGGNLAVLTDALPDPPREVATLAAKRGGGVSVARFMVNVAGDKLIRRYSLLIPPQEALAFARLDVDERGFSLGLAAAELKLVNFLYVDPQNVVNYGLGVSRALEDVVAIS